MRNKGVWSCDGEFITELASDEVTGKAVEDAAAKVVSAMGISERAADTEDENYADDFDD